MSPARSGRHSRTGSPSASCPTTASVLHPSSRAVTMARATSAASRSRTSAARQAVVGGRPEHRDRRAGGRAGAVVVEALVGGLSAGVLGDEPLEHRVDPVEDGRAGAEVRRQRDVAAEDLPRPQVHADVGPPEPVDRLLRVADDEDRPGRDRRRPPSARRRRPRRRRCGRRSRSGWGRCPGTRRGAGGCTGSGGCARTSALSRSTSRARTSRSWNSSSPAARRCSADSSTRSPHQRTTARRALSLTCATTCATSRRPRLAVAPQAVEPTAPVAAPAVATT